MLAIKTLVCIIVINLTSMLCDDSDQLVSLVLIWRHGDRTPIEPYPNDPYKNESYWPVGFGQLTNRGKQQHFALGRWLRARYAAFLPAAYSERDVYVRATDVDRTLMSAAANLAGLFPPRGAQVWDATLPWQPIPVHTAPEPADAVLAMKAPCARYARLYAELLESPFFAGVARANRELYANLTAFAGRRVSDLLTLEYLYNTLYIETLYGYELPGWTEGVYPDKMRKWADMSFETDCYTGEMARLKVGLLFNEISNHFRDAIDRSEQAKKLYIYSGHDTTIANTLKALGAFVNHSPGYANTIMIELRRNLALGWYVNIYYRKSDVLEPIRVGGCDFNCTIENLEGILAPIVLDLQEWQSECSDEFLYWAGFINLRFLLISSLFLLSVLLIGWFLTRVVKRRGGASNLDDYMKLPNDEVA